ncbi:flavin-containing amine oxidoreductase-domain containing protein [Pelagophyceae sp. CCMP2097]|nr:flavin-containing amine oxidoreductase-domain containing protein [Pelagophyceae sp. CCMP2097]
MVREKKKPPPEPRAAPAGGVAPAGGTAASGAAAGGAASGAAATGPRGPRLAVEHAFPGGCYVSATVDGERLVGVLVEASRGAGLSAALAAAAAPEHRVKLSAAPRVVVIGAGLAGLACAEALQASGARVVLLEARLRVGGRCCTVKLGDDADPPRVDMGASWIHGVRRNPLTAAAQQAGLHLVDTGDDVSLRCFKTGRILSGTKADTVAEAHFNAALGTAREKGDRAALDQAEAEFFSAFPASAFASATPAALPAARACGRHGAEFNLFEWFDRERQALRAGREAAAAADAAPTAAAPSDAAPSDAAPSDAMSDAFTRDAAAAVAARPADGGAEDAVEALISWHVANLEYANAAPLNALSLRHWDQDDVHAHGGAHVVLREGFSALAEHKAAALDVRTGLVVELVEEQVDGSFVVTGVGGSRFACEAVVCTLPLGCLKAGALRFSPPLPAFKELAISRLGFGLLNKVAILFSRTFWKDQKYWPDDRRPHLGRVGQQRASEFFMWSDLETATGAAVLVALVPAAAAEDLEDAEGGQGDAVRAASGALRRRCAEALAGLLGFPGDAETISGLVLDAQVSSWRRDEFSRGSYSFLAPNSTPKDVDALAAPLCRGRLRFAGEATSRTHLATAAGALQSGTREAALLASVLFDGDAKGSVDFSTEETPSTRCALCGLRSAEQASCPGFVAGDLMNVSTSGRACWVHEGCALFSPEVKRSASSFENVDSAVRRGRQLKCGACGRVGATLGCSLEKCWKSFHPRCAAAREKWNLTLATPLDAPLSGDRDVSDSDSDADEEKTFLPFYCLDHRPPPPQTAPPRPRHATSRRRPRKRPPGARRGLDDDGGANGAADDPERKRRLPPPPPHFGKPQHMLMRDRHQR